MRRPLLLFVAAVLMPAVVLAVLGFRTIGEDRRLIDSQIRETLDRSAEDAASVLERTMSAWRQAAATASAACSRSGEPTLSDPLLQAATAGGNGVFACLDGETIRARPAGSLAWRIGQPDPPDPHQSGPPQLRAAETLELVKEDFPGAARAYRAALGQPSLASHQAWLRHRLARTLAKAGRRDEALDVYRELSRSPRTLIHGLPSDLLARDGICRLLATNGREKDDPAVASCGASLYRDLVAGTWLLEKARYLHYGEAARAWASSTPEGAAAVAALAAESGRRAEMTAAVETVVARSAATHGATEAGSVEIVTTGTAPASFVAFVPGRADGRQAALVVRDEQFASLALAGALETGRAGATALSVADGTGRTWFPPSPGAGSEAPADARFATRTVVVDGSAWPVTARLISESPLAQQLELRHRIHVAMLVLMVVTLAFGIVVAGVTLRRALEVARLKSQFVSTVSHEFRSPLTAIRQLVELLARGRVPTDARRQEYYDTILRESDRLSRLVENVLDVSRMEDRRKEYRSVPIETAGWLRDAVAEFRRGPGSAGRVVEAAVPDDLPVVTGDREALARAVHNLLDNAVKYSPAAEPIGLDAEARDGWVFVHVRDRGPGIPENEQDRVFERFFRGSGTADSVKGTGLGLAIVRHAAEAHGGSVTFESDAGTGTVFTLRLPVR